jgi:hypothetical protein
MPLVTEECYWALFYVPLVTEERYWALFYMPLVTEECYWALFYMPPYTFKHNLLNVLVQISNKIDYNKKEFRRTGHEDVTRVLQPRATARVSSYASNRPPASPRWQRSCLSTRYLRHVSAPRLARQTRIQLPPPLNCPSSPLFFRFSSSKSKSKSHYDRHSVGQSVLVSGTHLWPATNSSFSLNFFLDSCGFVIL